MKEKNEQNKKKYKEQILEYIKQKGSVNLEELRKKWRRQTILYHIPKLCKKNLIRPYIKGSGIKDEEIFYTYVQKYEYPQEILRLIDEMCGNDLSQASQALNEFIDLCVKKGTSDHVARFLAYILMSGLSFGVYEGLKQLVAVNLSSCETVNLSFLIKDADGG